MCKSCKPIASPVIPFQSTTDGQWLLPIGEGFNAPTIEIRDIDGAVIVCPCSSCHETHSPDELEPEHANEDRKLCEDCRSTCDECGNVHDSHDEHINSAYDGDSDRLKRNEQIRCDECSWTCTDCDYRYYGDGSRNASRGKICNHCAQNYSTCETCNEVLHNDDMHYIEEDSASYCRSCYESRMEEIGTDDESSSDDDTVSSDDTYRLRHAVKPRLVHQYSYKPSACFYRADVDGTGDCEFYGLEIETETDGLNIDHDSAIRVSGIATDSSLYVKKDGSLAGDGEFGFEIVSHPASYAYWMTRNWEFCKALRECGYDSGTSNCGLHIHVSRAALTKAQIAKLLLFTKQNAQLFKYLSGRIDSDQMEHYAPIESGDTLSIIRKAQGMSTARYAAVNLENEQTIEFRLFQGTIIADEIRRNIALVRVLLAFIRGTPLTRMSAEDFRDYVAKCGRSVIGREMSSSIMRWLDSSPQASLAA